MRKILLFLFFVFNITSAYSNQDKTGTVTWFDIRTTNIQDSQNFFKKLFGWSFKKLYPGYDLILNKNIGIGGLSLAENLAPERQGVRLYFFTDKLQKSVSLALSIGAKLEQPPINIPNFGSYAVIRDLDNNKIALFSNKAI